SSGTRRLRRVLSSAGLGRRFEGTNHHPRPGELPEEKRDIRSKSFCYGVPVAWVNLWIVEQRRQLLAKIKESNYSIAKLGAFKFMCEIISYRIQCIDQWPQTRPDDVSGRGPCHLCLDEKSDLDIVKVFRL